MKELHNLRWSKSIIAENSKGIASLVEHQPGYKVAKTHQRANGVVNWLVGSSRDFL